MAKRSRRDERRAKKAERRKENQENQSQRTEYLRSMVQSIKAKYAQEGEPSEETEAGETPPEEPTVAEIAGAALKTALAVGASSVSIGGITVGIKYGEQEPSAPAISEPTSVKDGGAAVLKKPAGDEMSQREYDRKQERLLFKIEALQSSADLLKSWGERVEQPDLPTVHKDTSPEEAEYLQLQWEEKAEAASEKREGYFKSANMYLREASRLSTIAIKMKPPTSC